MRATDSLTKATRSVRERTCSLKSAEKSEEEVPEPRATSISKGLQSVWFQRRMSKQNPTAEFAAVHGADGFQALPGWRIHVSRGVAGVLRRAASSKRAGKDRAGVIGWCFKAIISMFYYRNR